MEKDIIEMMEFNEFIDDVIQSIPGYLQDYDIETILREKHVKGNGVVLTGIVIVCENENVAPCIYMDRYFVMYKSGTSMEDILKQVSDAYNMKRAGMPSSKIHIDINEMKDRIFMKLINYEANIDMLKTCPHIIQEDMAITFRLLFGKNDDGIASALIDNNQFSELDMSKNQLYELAKENMARIFPARIDRLVDILEAATDLDISELDVESPVELYVLTNDSGINGATCMFYSNVLDEAKKMIGDFYILPSSIHEVILMPKSPVIDVDELNCMVRDINKYVVDSRDVLSNNVYEYDEAEKQLKIVDPDRDRGWDFER